MKTFYVYQLRAENESLPFYIGKGTGKRKYLHCTAHRLKNQSYKNNKIKNCLLKGVKIKIETLYESECEQSCLEMEMFLIEMYGRKDIKTGILCNHTNGGEGVSGRIFKHTQESKNKLSIAHTGLKLPPRTEESKRKQSLAQTGIKFTEKRKLQMSLTQKNVIASYSYERKNEINKKISLSTKGKPKSDHKDAIEHIHNQKLSGLNQKEYCLKNNISINTFNTWKRNKFIKAVL